MKLRRNHPPISGRPPVLTRDQIDEIRRCLPLTPEETLHAMTLASYILDRLIRRLDRPMRRAPHDETRLGWARMKQRLESHRRRLHRQMRRMGEPEVQVHQAPASVPEVSWSQLFALYERLIGGTKDVRLKAVITEIWGETAIEHCWLSSLASKVGDLDESRIR